MKLCDSIKSICCYSTNKSKSRDVTCETDSDGYETTVNTDDLEEWLEGSIVPKFEPRKTLKKRELGTWIEVRLFISSTFIDTHSERDIIIRRVIPSINRKLANKFIRIIPVDLRWGVTAEESLNCFKIQKTCLNHIDKCRGKQNWTPWFLGLRTNRYGWVQDDYMRSEGFEQPGHFDWIDSMHKFNRGVSITSLECIHAAKIPKELSINPTVFFYEREIVEDADHQIPDKLRWIFDFEFVDKEILDPELKFQYGLDKDAKGKEKDRNKLNEFLKCQDHIIYRNFTSMYSHAKITVKRKDGKSFGVGYTRELQKFQDQVENDLYNAILENYKEVDNSNMNKYEFETIQHENAISDKATAFVGRKGLIATASKFLSQQGKSKKTMILRGEPGCGKSGLLAAVAQETIEKYRPKGHFVFTHMVDCCPGSTDLDVFLRRLNAMLRMFRRSLGEINLKREPPAVSSDLKNEHHDFMNESARKYPRKKFIVIIDAVNQFQSSMRAWDMWWLNNQDSPINLKFLISTLNEENCTYENAREMCPDAFCLPVLDMKREDLKEMIRGTLIKFNKKLTEEDDPLLGNQMDLLLEKSTSPLYLIAACEALRKFGVFERVTEYLKGLPTTVPELFEYLLDEWSNEYGEDFVHDVSGLICVSKNGILENQIQDILSFKERESGIVYEANFSRIYDSLAAFLSAGGGGYLRFFHDQLKFAVRRKFLANDLEKRTHSLLASFYLSVIGTQYDEAPKTKPMAYHGHALNQLVYHQLQAHSDGDPMDFLKDSLRNIYFLKERLLAGQQQELDDEYEMVSDKCSDKESLQSLADWRSFSQMYGGRIKEFKTFALNMAKNQAKSSHVRKDVSSLNMTSSKHYPFTWKNAPNQKDPMIVKYEGGGRDISASKVGNVVAIAGNDARLLHLSSGEVVEKLNVEANAIMMSLDGEKVLTGSRNGAVDVYDVSTGILELQCRLNLGGCVVFVHWDNKYIIAGTGAADGPICWDDNTKSSRILIANRKDGSTITTWYTEGTAFDYCFSSRMNMLFSSHKGGIVGWSLNGKELVRQSNNLGDVVYALANHATEDLILSGSNDLNIREWKITKQGTEMSLVNEVKDSTSSGWYYGGNWAVSYDHSGDRILSTEPQSQSLRVYHRNGTLLNELRGHQECINKISLVQDGSHVVTCDRGDLSILWKLPDESASEEEEKIDDKVVWCSFNPDGSMYVTAAEGILRIFDVGTNALLHTNRDACCYYSLSGTWMPDGKHFVVINNATGVAWFDCELKMISEVMCFETDDSGATDLAISPDGTKVVVTDCMNYASSSSTAAIIDCSNVKNPVKCGMISDYGARMFACDINHNGELVAIAGHAGTVVYNIDTCKRQYTMNSGTFYVHFKSDDKLLYGSEDNLYLYDPQKGEDIVIYEGHTGTVKDACFLDNERKLLTAGSDGTLRLFEVSTGENLYAFFSHQAQGYNSISTNANENTIIAADESRTLYLLSTEIN